MGAYCDNNIESYWQNQEVSSSSKKLMMVDQIALNKTENNNNTNSGEEASMIAPTSFLKIKPSQIRSVKMKKQKVIQAQLPVPLSQRTKNVKCFDSDKTLQQYQFSEVEKRQEFNRGLVTENKVGGSSKQSITSSTIKDFKMKKIIMSPAPQDSPQQSMTSVKQQENNTITYEFGAQKTTFENNNDSL